MYRARRLTSCDDVSLIERETSFRMRHRQSDRHLDELIPSRSDADDPLTILIQMNCAKSSVASRTVWRRRTSSRKLQVDVESLSITLEDHERLIARMRREVRIGSEISIREEAMRVLKDDAGEADLRQLELQLPSDGGLFRTSIRVESEKGN